MSAPANAPAPDPTPAPPPTPSMNGLLNFHPKFSAGVLGGLLAKEVLWAIHLWHLSITQGTATTIMGICMGLGVYLAPIANGEAQVATDALNARLDALNAKIDGAKP